MFGRQTLIALRARRQAHRIASDFLLPHIYLGKDPLIIHTELSPDEDLRLPIDRTEPPPWLISVIYLGLVVAFMLLLFALVSLFNSFLVSK